MDFHFDEDKAARAVKFISNLTHTKGKWARKPFELLDWELDLVCTAFGMVDDAGLRQYRIVYVEIPKKNGKTELAAALGLYMLTADGENSPEVYSAAADKNQASLIYLPASQMVKNNEELSSRLLIRDSVKRIINPKNNGFYQVLSSDVKTKHGINPSCVLFDELHAQPNDELWRVLTSGTDYAREQQLIFVFTTAGIYDVNSIWWRIRNKARQIRDDIIKDDSFLPVLYIADPEKDKIDDEKLWARVNPSLGRIFTIDKIRKDYESIKGNPVEEQDFKRYRLDIPIKQEKKWLDPFLWDKCKGEIDYLKLEKQIAYGALDLSSTQDLTARALVFPHDDAPWEVFAHAYCPEDTILKKSKKDQVHYDIWADMGFITPTPGNCVDYAFIKKDILEDAEKYDLREVGFDPYGATMLTTTLENSHGITMVEMRQGALTFSGPIKDILKAILGLKLVHDGNPVLRWCIDNVVMVEDANENLRPAKDKSTGRIDLFVALIMAWSRAMVNMASNKKSVYEERGLIEL